MPEMKHIRISPEKGIEIIDADALPALKPLQQSDKCAYRRFSDPRDCDCSTSESFGKASGSRQPQGRAAPWRCVYPRFTPHR